MLVISVIRAKAAKTMEGNAATSEVRHAWRLIVVVLLYFGSTMCVIHCMSHDLHLSGSESIIMAVKLCIQKLSYSL